MYFMKSFELFELSQLVEDIALGPFERRGFHLFELPAQTGRPQRQPLFFLVGVDKLVLFDNDSNVRETRRLSSCLLMPSSAVESSFAPLKDRNSAALYRFNRFVV